MLRTDGFVGSAEPRWPFESTSHHGVRALLPSQVLDLRARRMLGASGLEHDRIACPSTMARAFDLGLVPSAPDTHRRWLEEVFPLARTVDIPPWVLFYWESRVGRWAANGQS